MFGNRLWGFGVVFIIGVLVSIWCLGVEERRVVNLGTMLYDKNRFLF